MKTVLLSIFCLVTINSYSQSFSENDIIPMNLNDAKFYREKDSEESFVKRFYSIYNYFKKRPEINLPANYQIIYKITDYYENSNNNPTSLKELYWSYVVMGNLYKDPSVYSWYRQSGSYEKQQMDLKVKELFEGRDDQYIFKNCVEVHKELYNLYFKDFEFEY